MASTLAGNFTVLGSIANLIVVEKAARRGVVIGFWDYFRVGAPLTLADAAGGNVLADVALRSAHAQERAMDRIRVLEESLWPQVPAEVIEEAKQAAQTEPSWIAMQGNGHVVAMAAAGQSGHGDRRCDLHRRGQSGEVAVGRCPAASRASIAATASRQIGDAVDHHVGVAQFGGGMITQPGTLGLRQRGQFLG